MPDKQTFGHRPIHSAHLRTNHQPPNPLFLSLLPLPLPPFPPCCQYPRPSLHRLGGTSSPKLPLFSFGCPISVVHPKHPPARTSRYCVMQCFHHKTL